MEFINIGEDFTAYVGAEEDLFEGTVQEATVLLFSNRNNAKVTIDKDGVRVQKGSRQWFDEQVGFAQGIGKPRDTSGHTSTTNIDAPIEHSGIEQGPGPTDLAHNAAQPFKPPEGRPVKNKPGGGGGRGK